MKGISVALALLLVAAARADDYDLVIYGGTSGGISAAIHGARLGKRVVLIEPSKHLGGMTTGGLGATDRGSPRTVSGLAREFYRGLYDYYSNSAAWKYETRAEYLPKHPWTTTEDLKLHWFFEPHAADRHNPRVGLDVRPEPGSSGEGLEILTDKFAACRIPIRFRAVPSLLMQQRRGRLVDVIRPGREHAHV